MQQGGWEGLEIARGCREKWWEGRFLYHLAYSLYRQHNYTEARQLGEESLELADEIGDPWLIGSVCTVLLGEVAFNMGDFPEAMKMYQRGLAAFEEIGMPWGIGRAYRNLGGAALALNNIEEAEHYYRQSLLSYRESGQTFETLNTLMCVANLHVAIDRSERAVELLT